MKELNHFMNKSAEFELLKNLKEEAQKRFKVELKGVFGSYARGEARPESDVDILVAFQDGATLLDLAGLGDFLEEKLQRKVDIVSQRAIRPEIQDAIYRDLISL